MVAAAAVVVVVVVVAVAVAVVALAFFFFCPMKRHIRPHIVKFLKEFLRRSYHVKHTRLELLCECVCVCVCVFLNKSNDRLIKHAPECLLQRYAVCSNQPAVGCCCYVSLPVGCTALQALRLLFLVFKLKKAKQTVKTNSLFAANCSPF